MEVYSITLHVLPWLFRKIKGVGDLSGPFRARTNYHATSRSRFKREQAYFFSSRLYLATRIAKRMSVGRESVYFGVEWLKVWVWLWIFFLGFSEHLLLRSALDRLLDAESLALRNYLRDPTNHSR